MSVLTSGFLRQNPKYLPAEVPDAVNTTLAANSAPQSLFQYGTLRQAQRAYRLGGVALPTTAGVTLALSADTRVATPLTSAALALVGASDPPRRQWDAHFADRFALTAQNTTSAALDTYWATIRLRILTPSIGLRAADPATWGPLSAADQALATQFDLTGARATGSRWLDFEGIRDRVYAPNVVLAAVYGQQLTVTTSTPALTVSPKAGEILVLRALAVSPGTGSDGLTVTASIDEDAAFAAWPAYGFGSQVVPCFIQATEQIQVSLSATTSTTATVAALIWHVRITPAIAVRLRQQAPVAVQDAVRAGVA